MFLQFVHNFFLGYEQHDVNLERTRGKCLPGLKTFAFRCYERTPSDRRLHTHFSASYCSLQILRTLCLPLVGCSVSVSLLAVNDTGNTPEYSSCHVTYRLTQLCSWSLQLSQVQVRNPTNKTDQTNELVSSPRRRSSLATRWSKKMPRVRHTHTHLPFSENSPSFHRLNKERCDDTGF